MSTDKDIIALFNYGGGMRGLIPAHIMARIEDVTGLRMVDMVDIFSGPSTGAILNAALNVPHPDEPDRPKYRARHLIKFYEREGLNIFPYDRFREFRALIHDFNNRTMRIGQLNALFRKGHYDPRHLGKSLRDLFGDTKLSESLRSLIIPVFNIDGEQLEIVEEAGDTGNTPVHTRGNVTDRGGHAVWLKSMQPELRKRPAPDVSLFDAVVASTAAPTYFPCHHFKVKYGDGRGTREYSGIDGSIFDNPCISYHGAIRRHIPEGRKLKMIMLGTGHTLKSIKKEEWNNYGGLGVVDPVNDLPLINILFHASETALMESFGDEMRDSLFIFNKRMGANGPAAQIDDASPGQLERLKTFAEEMLEENKKQFDDVCHLLATNRDRKVEEKKTAPKGGIFSFFGRKKGG